MLSMKQIEIANEKIEKIKQEKVEVINNRDDVIDYKHHYMIGGDGKISGATTIYLNSGEATSI